MLELPQRQADWHDTFTGINGMPDQTAQEALAYALNHPPFWFLPAMKLRNLLVKPFGLITEQGLDSTNQNDSAKNENLLHHLPVALNEEHHFICGIIDNHLTFSIEVIKHDGNISLTTNIWFNHFMGRVYLGLVYPFHKLVMKHAIAQLKKARARSL